MSLILLLAPEDDTHALVVGERLREAGREFLIVNTTWFPWRNRMTWTLDGPAASEGLASFNLTDVSVVWWRRFRHSTPSPAIADPNVRRFCATEATTFLRQVLTEVHVVINDPAAERAASQKLAQLRRAREHGIRVPETIVSNDRQRILAFIERHDEVICKTLVCDYPHSIPTRRCTALDFADEASASLAPTVVQELVPCRRDIRVCVVGDEVYAGELFRADAAEAVDWRMTASGWRRHALPDELARSLRALIRSFRLDMASIDLRLTPDDDYIFFEINPSGQFLFLEIDAGLPLSRAVAHYLAHATAREA